MKSDKAPDSARVFILRVRADTTDQTCVEKHVEKDRGKEKIWHGGKGATACNYRFPFFLSP
jgi:hypothetical protein